MDSIVGRGVALGAALGIIPGAGAGALLGGMLGTVFGALAGALWGAIYGAIGGLALALLHRHGGSRARARSVAAATSAACALLTETVVYSGFVTAHARIAVAFTIVCTVLGAVVGPATMLGLRPFAVGRRRRPWQDAATRLLVVVLLVCGGLGAATGLVIGVHVSLPTSPVAAVEGAVVGVGVGVALWAATALVLFVPRLRANR